MNVKFYEDDSGTSKKMRYFRKNKVGGPGPSPESATVGRTANCSLCVFGKPYKRASLDPFGRRAPTMDFGRIFRTTVSNSFSLYEAFKFAVTFLGDVKLLDEAFRHFTIVLEVVMLVRGNA